MSSAEGRLPEAMQVLDTAIAQRRDELGLRDRELAAAVSTRALVAVESGHYEQAYELAEEGLTLFRDLGMEHTNGGLAALNNRAVSALFLRRIEEAIADFGKVIEIHRELFGRNAQLATVEINLARLLIDLRRADEAVPLAREALDICIAERGEIAQISVLARSILAEALADTGQVDEALPLAERAVADAFEHHRDNSNPFYLTTLRTRAVVRAAAGDLDGARTDLDEGAALLETMGPGKEAHQAKQQIIRSRLLGEAN